MLHVEHSCFDGSICLCCHRRFLYRLKQVHETVLAMRRLVEVLLQLDVKGLVALCEKYLSFKMYKSATKMYVRAYICAGDAKGWVLKAPKLVP